MTSTHFPPEDIMAHLDGELPPAEAQSISAHLDSCAECAAIAQFFRATSESFAQWTVPPIPGSIDSHIRAAAVQTLDRLPRPSRKPWLIGAATCTAGLLLVAIINNQHKTSQSASLHEYAYSSTPPALTDSIAAAYAPAAPDRAMSKQKQALTNALARSREAESVNLAEPPPPSTSSSPAPQIARTVSLTLVVKSVDAARPALDAILARHLGYPAQLTVTTPAGQPHNLQASLRVPAPALAGTLADLKSLGQVATESQSGEDVSQQHADLDARLATARDTEQRFRSILQQRTGSISDVLEVQERIAQVRGEIESMESGEDALNHRVAFVSIDLQLTEEYVATLSSPGASAPTRMYNSLITGLHNAASTLLALILFVEEAGPTVLLLLLILALPAAFLYRRYRKVRSRL